jgi:serine/threonine-protein kinase
MSASAKPSSEPAFGLKLPSRYRVLRHIANGGMASVWCAQDGVLGRNVAIKVLSDRFAHDALAIRRFKREARAAARVSAHPHVVTIYDVGDLEPDGDESLSGAFIVMEYLAGGTVGDAIRVKSASRADTRRWLREAASALDHAHERGIVHRDIKPANFLLDRERSLHVADFGIARLEREETITSAGELFGTAAYLSPEQALGRDATGASDRYALAVAGFELLTGGRPFTAPHFAAQARQHIEDEPPRASEQDRTLSPAVDDVLRRGMAKDPADRYVTAGAFVDALDGALDDSETAATRPLGAGGRGAVRSAPIAAAGAAVGGLAGDAYARAADVQDHGRGPVAGRAAAAGRAPATARTAVRPHRTAVTSPITRGPVSTHHDHGGRAAAVLALAVVAIGVILLIIQLTGSSSKPAAASGSTSHSGTAAHRSRARSSASHSSSSSSSTAASSAQTPAQDAAALQAQGHQELLAHNYSAAIATLRRAVTAAQPGSLTYAYALYDLGDALLLSGNPKAAVPVLEQRLKIPNQTATVQATLNQALQAAGMAPAAPQPGGPGKGHGHGHGPGAGG